jgi:hypothetical protein
MIDFGMGFIYNLGKDLWKHYIPSKRNLHPEEVIKYRARWKEPFEGKIREIRAADHESDVIIRDIDRLDEYPETPPDHPRWQLWRKEGISSWFKAGLMGTYDSGIMAGLRWERIIQKDGQWCFHRSSDKASTLKVMIIGRIPYENIEDVDWSGDDYYGNGQIYCHFTISGQPYRDVAVYEVVETEYDTRYFREIGTSKEIHDNTERLKSIPPTPAS